MHQLARAIHHLHSGDPHIIHRDIKPQNIVVTEAERSEKTGLLKCVKVKLIDLGKFLSGEAILPVIIWCYCCNSDCDSDMQMLPLNNLPSTNL